MESSIMTGKCLDRSKTFAIITEGFLLDNMECFTILTPAEVIWNYANRSQILQIWDNIRWKTCISKEKKNKIVSSPSIQMFFYRKTNGFFSEEKGPKKIFRVQMYKCKYNYKFL